MVTTWVTRGRWETASPLYFKEKLDGEVALYVDLNERKVAEFENEKIKIMDDFINKNKSQFKDENLKFSSKLKKWK